MASAAKPSSITDNAGKLAVIGMLSVALLAAAVAWWWNYNRGNQALELYGPEAARLIRTAPIVELIPVESGVTAPQSLDGRQVGQTIDVSRSPGLIHARTSLLDDASYAWDASPPPAASNPVLIRFSHGDDSALVYVYLEEGSVTASPSGRSAQLVAKTADGWRSFVRRNLAANPNE